MAIQAALNSTQKGYLRAGSWRAQQYLSLAPNTNIYTAQVDGTPSGNVFASLAMKNTSGTAGDAWAGFTVLISRTNDKEAAFWRGRVRKAISGATLYINETSADIQDDDYIFIIQDVALHEKLPREAGGTRYNDWDRAAAQLPPVINNLQVAYAGFVSGGALQIRFQPSAIAATSGASISSYQFTMPTGYGSVAAGALNTNDVTIDFNEGVWIVKLVVTDSGGRTATRYIFVFAHGSTTTPALGFGGADIAAGRDGFGASVAAFDGVEDVLDNTFAVIWRAHEFYGATEANLGNNIDMVGRFRSESTQVSGETGMYETRFTIEGPAQQMRSTASQLITATNESSPSAWDEIADLTPWRALVYMLAEFSTFFHCFCLSFDSTAATYEVQAIDADPSNLWDMARALLTNVDKALEFRHDGHGFVSPNGNYAASATRDTLPTIIDLETQDYLSITAEHAHGPTVGQIIGFGGYYTTSTGATAPLASIAPGHAQGAGAEKSQRADFILEADSTKAAAQTELGRRLGNHFAAANPKDRISADLPDGYYALTPSVGTWYTWTLAETDTGRKDYGSGDRWTLAEISFSHDNATGARAVSAVFERETSADDAGISAQTYTLANPYAAADASFDFFPDSSFAPFPDDPANYLPANITLEQQHPFNSDPLKVWTPVPANGNTALVGETDSGDNLDSGLYLTFSYIGAAPEWFDITPAAGVEIRHACFKLQTGRAAYCLTYDDSDSYFYYTTDVFASPVVWTAGATLSGLWDYIRVAESGVYVVRAPVAGDAETRYSTDDGATFAAAVALGTTPGLEQCGFDVVRSGDTAIGSSYNQVVYATAAGGAYSAESRAPLSNPVAILIPLWKFDADGDAVADLNTDTETPDYLLGSTTANVQADWDFEVSCTDGWTFTNGVCPPAQALDFDIHYDFSSGINIDTIVVTLGNIGGGNATLRVYVTSDSVEYKILDKSAGNGDHIATNTYPDVTRVRITATRAFGFNILAVSLTGAETYLYKVTADGATNIPPDDGYAAFNPNGFAMCDVDGLHIAALMTSVPGGSIHLFTTEDAGDTWNDRGALVASSKWLRMRSQSANQLFFVQGASGLGYSADFGATLITKTAPGGRIPQFIEVYG
jgi:hypothetical protein